MKQFRKSVIDKYRSIPFWSWNDKLEKYRLISQIKWMKKSGFGGYFMHARGGLITEYLSDEWFSCINASINEGKKLKMQSWAYDENGWPSGFAGGKLLEDEKNCDRYLEYTLGEYDTNAYVSYEISGKSLHKAKVGDSNCINIYSKTTRSTADILSYEVVEKFIKETHEKYKEKLGDNFKNLSGFFTDEPQYQRWHHPYTIEIEKYFKKEYNEDIKEKLGLLFVEKEGYREFRYKYWKGMQTLMLNNYSKHVYDWCEKNSVKLTGHYIEESTLEYQMLCNGGIMPFYEYEHIPGMDWLGREIGTPIAPKQVSSVSRQLGKKQVLTETFACAGWDVTPKELKQIAEWQYVNGINLMCEHLLPYSEVGQRKRDYPNHFSYVNPWIRENFKGFNDYFAKLGCLLGESEEIVNVAMFSPIRSMYFDYKRENFGSMYESIDTYYINLAVKLSAMNIPYHIIDETILSKHGKVEDGKLIVGNCKYDYIIFPKTITMDNTTEKLLNEFYKVGGKLLFTEGVPNYLEGKEHKYSLTTNTSYEEIIKAQSYTVDNYDTKVESTLREIDNKKYLYAVNLSLDKEYDVEFKGSFSSFESYDIETGRTKVIDRKVHFDKGQSYILYLSNKESKKEPIKKEVILDEKFKLIKNTDNYFTLDKISISEDGINYNKENYTLGVFDELLQKRYKGKLYVKYSFEIEKIPDTIYFLCEDMNNISCRINGKEISFTGHADFEEKIGKADIKDKVKTGINEAIVLIDFYEDQKVYYALYGEGVTESLRNCLTYNTSLESAYICGDFGVYSKTGFTQCKEDNVLIGDNFYISEKKNEIESFTKDGFPFFSGKAVIEQEVEIEDTNSYIDFTGRVFLFDLFINNKKVNKSYFETKVDISRYVKKGKNKLRIELISGNRNLLGPHHVKNQEEPKAVGPEAFTLGNWENGKNNNYRGSYSFVELYKNKKYDKKYVKQNMDK